MSKWINVAVDAMGGDNAPVETVKGAVEAVNESGKIKVYLVGKQDVLEKELAGLGIGSWIKPRGGYFISFNSLPGCAKEIVAKCKHLGVVLTDAGATFPYGKDPEDSNIRIAPTFPTPEEMAQAAEVFVLCVKLTSVEKLAD